MVMPNGWHYPQGNFTVRADTFEDLVEALIQHRLNNKIPVGDVVVDIENYVCSKYPRSCHSTMGNPVPLNVSPSKMIDSVMKYANEMYGHSHEFVTDTEANRRAEICRNCACNIAWENACATCVGHAKRLLAVIRQNRDVSQHSKLHQCQVTKHDNRTAVWIKNNKTHHKVPSNCWMEQ